MKFLPHRIPLIAAIVSVLLFGTTPLLAQPQDTPKAPKAPRRVQSAQTITTPHHRSDPGYLGVDVIELSPELRAHFGAPKNVGIMISTVGQDSPAKKAKLKVGDVIIAADNHETHSVPRFRRIVRAKQNGQTLNLKVVRNKKTITIKAKLKGINSAFRHRAPSTRRHRQDRINVSPFVYVTPDGQQDFEIHLNLKNLETNLNTSLNRMENSLNRSQLKDISEMKKNLQQLKKHVESLLDDPRVKQRVLDLRAIEKREKQMLRDLLRIEVRIKNMGEKLKCD